jgi:hypothetical protein
MKPWQSSIILLVPFLFGCDAYFRVSQPVNVQLTNPSDHAPIAGATISSPDRSRADSNGPIAITDTSGHASVDVRYGFILCGISGWFDNPYRDRLSGAQCTFNVSNGTNHERLTVRAQPNAWTTGQTVAISIVSVGPAMQLRDTDSAK